MVKEEKKTKSAEKSVSKKKDSLVKKKVSAKKTKDVSLVGETTFKNELRKIKWPTKKEMVKYSIATIVFVIFFAIFFYIIELLMALIKSMV